MLTNLPCPASGHFSHGSISSPHPLLPICRQTAAFPRISGGPVRAPHRTPWPWWQYPPTAGGRCASAWTTARVARGSLSPRCGSPRRHVMGRGRTLGTPRGCTAWGGGDPSTPPQSECWRYTEMETCNHFHEHDNIHNALEWDFSSRPFTVRELFLN